jgi:hypothetical protein
MNTNNSSLKQLELPGDIITRRKKGDYHEILSPGDIRRLPGDNDLILWLLQMGIAAWTGFAAFVTRIREIGRLDIVAIVMGLAGFVLANLLRYRTWSSLLNMTCH